MNDGTVRGLKKIAGGKSKLNRSDEYRAVFSFKRSLIRVYFMISPEYVNLR